MNACFETLKGTALRSTKSISREQYLHFRTFMTKTLVYKCKLCQVLLAICLREVFTALRFPCTFPENCYVLCRCESICENVTVLQLVYLLAQLHWSVIIAKTKIF